MQQFLDVMRRQAAMMDAQQGKLRFGTVSSYDPNTGSAQVLLQPEGMLSGWLPVLSPSVGSGWGVHIPLNVGDQVAVMPHEGDANHGVVLGRCFSNAARPPSSSGADMVLRSRLGATVMLQSGGGIVLADPSGSSITLSNSGGITISVAANVTISAPTVTVTNNLSVGTGATGSFTAASGQNVTVADGIITNIY